MNLEFSPMTKTWLNNQALLAAAEERFRKEWANVMESVKRRCSGEGWSSPGAAGECTQFYKDGWPSGSNGTHFEFYTNTALAREDLGILFLHVEGDTPNQEEVCDVLRKLMRPYASQVMANIPGCSVTLPETPTQDIIAARFSLSGASSDSLRTAFKGIRKIETFVDEALFLAGKTRLVRVDCTGENPLPLIAWHGNTGGWHFNPDCGRLGRPGLVCYEEPKNHKNLDSLLTLREGLFHEIASGKRVYGSVTVRAPEGGTIRFLGEATGQGNWQKGFDKRWVLDRSDAWRHESFEEDVGPARDYDFTKDGMQVYFIVEAPPSGLWIDAIELGFVP